MSKTAPMTKKQAPQSAPPHRVGRACGGRHRPNSTTGSSNSGATRGSRNAPTDRNGDLQIVDIENEASEDIAAVSGANGTITSHVADATNDVRSGRCQTAPADSHSSGALLSSTGTIVLESRSHSQQPTVASTSRKTINRSNRKSRPQSILSALDSRDDALSVGRTDTSSEIDDTRTTITRGTAELIDFGGTDIYNDNGWDTDLEEEEEGSVDRSIKAIYLECCRQSGVIPASYFLRHMTQPELQMKHHGLGPHGIKPISVALVSNTHVLTLNLTDNWLGHVGGHHVCDMLKENCYITHIDLSDNKLDFRFAENFIDVLEHNVTLTHVILSGNDFDDRAAVYLAEAIMGTTRLEYLNLSRNQLTETAGKILGPAIAENSSLRHLDLSWNALRRKGAVAIAQGLKNNVLLQKMDLSWNGFALDGAKALGDALKVNSSLEELDLSNNRITTEAAVLLGKGLSVNESLRVLQIGKNPMQSSGCYGICAAINKNPNPVMEHLDFSDIMINSDFKDVYNKLKEKLPDLRLRHGGDGVPKRPKARVHPMVKLQNYITKHNLKLLDFFNKFDSDGSMSVSREEFTEGIHQTGIKLTDDEVGFLLDELDADGDGEINYSELVMGHQDFTEKERKMATTIMQYKR